MTVLYLNDSTESKMAERLLAEAGIAFEISDAEPEYLRRPCLARGQGFHQGLDSIRTWLDAEEI